MWLSTSEARKYVRNNNLNSATDVKHIMWYGYKFSCSVTTIKLIGLELNWFHKLAVAGCNNADGQLEGVLKTMQ